jgi:hypothetical protein
MFKIGFLVFCLSTAKYSSSDTSNANIIFDSSVVLVAEVMAETFSDVRCPPALVIVSLLPSHVLAVGSRITYLSMVKNLLTRSSGKN